MAKSAPTVDSAGSFDVPAVRTVAVVQICVDLGSLRRAYPHNKCSNNRRIDVPICPIGAIGRFRTGRAHPFDRMRESIDINCDLGECDALDELSVDALLMPWISSCNVACGEHAGNDEIMRHVVALAGEHRVAVGAHVSYADRENFGRVSMPIRDDAFSRLVCTQIERFVNAISLSAGELRHVKPHGALYHDLNQDEAFAHQFVTCIAEECDSLARTQLPIFAMAGSLLTRVCDEHGHPCLHEGFADRRYLSARQLAPRSPNGNVDLAAAPAVLYPVEAAEQAAMLASGKVVTETGVALIQCDTLCIHSDTPDAVTLAEAVSQRMAQLGIHVARLDNYE